MSLVVFPGEPVERAEMHGGHGPHAETQRNGDATEKTGFDGRAAPRPGYQGRSGSRTRVSMPAELDSCPRSDSALRVARRRRRTAFPFVSVSLCLRVVPFPPSPPLPLA